MTGIIDWIKNNKLTLILLLIIIYLLTKSFSPFYGFANLSGTRTLDRSESLGIGGASPMIGETDMAMLPPVPGEVPPSDSSDRLVIHDTNLSLQVDDVAETLNRIQETADSLGGFLVNSNLNRPEGAASGAITVRVPEENRQQALEAFRGLAVKVVSESVSGRDVTDQFEDLNAKLVTLTATKTKFEAILEQAEEIQDILEVQRQIISLQSQIDNLKGRQQYLEQSANLSKITIYVSTDELALPYTPDEAWRPEVIFKQAVRSLVGTVREVGTLAIWLVVYAPIWLLALAVYVIWHRRLSKPPVQ